MTKDEQLEANALLSEAYAQRDMALNRCSRYAVEIAKAQARIEELEKKPEPETELKAVP